jgi:hypothetical protein
MDGIDWQHHLGSDGKDTPTFSSVRATKTQKKCIAGGGRCGVVEVEVRLIRWVEEQRLDLERQARKKRRRSSAAEESRKEAK